MVKISKFESLLGTNLWKSWYGILGRHRLWLISPTKFWIYAIVCVCSVWSAHKWGWTLSQWVVVDLVVGVADWNVCAPYVQSCESFEGMLKLTPPLSIQWLHSSVNMVIDVLHILVYWLVLFMHGCNLPLDVYIQEDYFVCLEWTRALFASSFGSYITCCRIYCGYGNSVIEELPLYSMCNSELNNEEQIIL